MKLFAKYAAGYLCAAFVFVLLLSTLSIAQDNSTLPPIYTEEIKSHLAPVYKQYEDNPAYTEDNPQVNPRLTEWSRQMQKTIYEPVKDHVYCAVGWQLTTTCMAVGDTGIVIIDPGENDEAAAEILEEFRKITDKPIKGVVYTHRHPDHPFGVKGLGITEEDVEAGKVEIFASDQFMPYLVNDSALVGPILSVRTAYGAASFLPQGKDGMVNGALGPTFRTGTVSLIPPTQTFSDELETEVGDVKMILFHAYGDAEDEIDVYFPEWRHVHGSETIQGETFPNLYTLRGTKFRDPVKWYKGVDNLLAYAKKSDSYSASHMRPWVGNEFIVERITNYRDAIQYVHDQSIRNMNKGLTREELVEAVKLPEHLKNDPWLQPYYGTVPHSVRNFYNGYLGWYQGDATELATPGYVEKSKLYVDAMGGRDKVIENAKNALDNGNYGWTMEVLTHVIRVNHDDMEARKLKAEAMRKWGYQQDNIYWRDFALVGAAELDGTLDRSNMWNFAAPDIIKTLPPGPTLESLSVRLDAEKAKDANLTLGINFPDLDQGYGLEIRKGVCVFYDSLPEKTDATLTTNKQIFDNILLGETTVKEAASNGDIKIEGSEEAVTEFFGYFDQPGLEEVNLVVR